VEETPKSSVPATAAAAEAAHEAVIIEVSACAGQVAPFCTRQSMWRFQLASRVCSRLSMQPQGACRRPVECPVLLHQRMPQLHTTQR
jgi:hypothetical protein